MKQERVIAILDFYRDIDKTVTMNERVIRNLEDQLTFSQKCKFRFFAFCPPLCYNTDKTVRKGATL